ncbi:MAG: hypothetical protein ABSE73_13910, partial [Planctomycetota bacterium]
LLLLMVAFLPLLSLTRIEVESPLQQTVTQGDDVVLRARLAGQVPDEPRCTLHLAGAGNDQAVVMAPRPQQRYETQLKGIDRSLVFFITAGDGRSALYRVDVAPRPTVTKLRVRYDYPRYTLLPPHEEQMAQREFSGVEGTRVTVQFESSMPVADSQAAFPDRKYKIAWDESRRQGTFRFLIERETSFTIRLVADSGSENRNDPVYRVRAVPDNPPTVMLLGIPENAALYRDDLLLLQYKGADDFGIAEVFLRCRSQSEPRPKEYSLQLQRPNQKQVEGEAPIELRELTAEDDSQLELELVMVDTKGQEASSPRVRLAIISDTPERQLEELAKLEDEYLRNCLRPAATALTAQAGRLGILLEGMDPGTAIAGKRKEMLDGIRKDLERVRLPGAGRAFFLTEYPYQSVRAAHYALSMSRSLVEGPFYAARFNAVLTGNKVREGLAEFKPFIEEQAKLAEALAGGLADTLLETRLRLMGHLAEKLHLGIPSPPRAEGKEAPGSSKEAEGKAAQQREERLAKLLALGEALGTEAETLDLAAVLGTLKAAAASGGETRAAAVAAAVAELHRALLSGTALDGHLGARTEACRAQYPQALLMRKALAQGTGVGFMQALSDLVRLSRTSYIPNDAEVLLGARMLEALISGEEQRTSAAAAAWERLEPWARRYGLVERLRLLRIALQEFQIDVAVGRLQLPSAPAGEGGVRAPSGSVRSEQRWQEVREMFLALLCDRRAGLFAPLGREDEAQIALLDPFRDLLLPWSDAAALGTTAGAERAAALRARLGELIARLEPGLLKETQAACPQFALLWRDVAFNVQQETGRLAAEKALVLAEITDAENRPAAEKEHPDFIHRNAAPARAGFGHDLAARMAAHAAALTSGLNIFERLWMQDPSPQPPPAAGRGQGEGPLPQGERGLEAAAILNEYLSHLEEDVYDNASAPHINRAWGGLKSGPYPKYLETIVKYYDEFAPKARVLGGWLADLADVHVDALLSQADFTGLPVKINRMERCRAAAKALREQLRFAAEARAAANPAARRPLLRALLDGENATVYWDRLCLAASGLAEATGRALQAPTASWAGVNSGDRSSADAAAARVRWLLPDAGPWPEEAKLLPDLLEEWRELGPRAAAEKAAALAAEGRAELREGLQDWHGRLLGVLRGMEVRTFVAPPKPRVRPRYLRGIRNDFQELLGRILRGEALWAARAACEERRVWSVRAQFLAGVGPEAPGLDEAAWMAAFAQATERKSAAASARRSNALGLEQEQIDERFLKMPRHLYEELLRAAKRPYPSQFKGPGLEYIQGLLKDSR